MDNVVTDDWGDFGYREIDMAKELLSHVKEIDSMDKLTVYMNRNSGYVFICDEDYRTWMMNGDNIEEWFNCGYCGHEGFLEDMDHDPENEECTRYLKDIGAIEDDEEDEFMSHFFGRLQGNRGEATRGGSKNSGMTTYCASRDGAIRCGAYVKDGVDWVLVTKTTWREVGEYKVIYEGPIGV